MQLSRCVVFVDGVNDTKLAMTSIVRAAYAVLLQLVAVIKRMLCFLHIRRRRNKSGNILPLHADVKTLSVGEIQTSLPSNDVRPLCVLVIYRDLLACQNESRCYAESL